MVIYTTIIDYEKNMNRAKKFTDPKVTINVKESIFFLTCELMMSIRMMHMPNDPGLKIFLGGDVMTGRGIDQILSHPVDPHIYESYVTDAREYIALAEQINGLIPRLNHGRYIWGDALNVLELRKPDLRLINLETSVTSKGTPCINKGIQYRMHPDNLDALTAAKIDVCSLANNHVLDWGIMGFHDTLTALDRAQIAHAGAGTDLKKAQKPAIVTVSGLAGRVLVFSIGAASSGIPNEWRATAMQPGIWFMDDFSSTTINQIKEQIERYSLPGDFCILSIHWGGNWVYQVPEQHQDFAHELIDKTRINLIHGHSSHHPSGMELYKKTPVFYGCGDLINDYEGITNNNEFKNDLALMYFVTLDSKSREIKYIELVPMERRKFSLHYCNNENSEYLLQLIKNQSAPFNTQFKWEHNAIRWITT